MEDELDAGEDAEGAADESDEEAVGGEDGDDAFLGGAEGFEDADVTGFVADDHVEDEEDDDEDDEGHESEDEGDHGFFVFDGADVEGLFFIPGFDVEGDGAEFGVGLDEEVEGAVDFVADEVEGVGVVGAGDFDFELGAVFGVVHLGHLLDGGEGGVDVGGVDVDDAGVGVVDDGEGEGFGLVGKGAAAGGDGDDGEEGAGVVEAEGALVVAAAVA